MTDTPTRLFIAAYHDGLSPRYEVVPEGAMGAEPWIEEAPILALLKRAYDAIGDDDIAPQKYNRLMGDIERALARKKKGKR